MEFGPYVRQSLKNRLRPTCIGTLLTHTACQLVGQSGLVSGKVLQLLSITKIMRRIRIIEPSEFFPQCNNSPNRQNGESRGTGENTGH